MKAWHPKTGAEMREYSIAHMRFARDAVPAYLAEHPVPGPDTDPRRVTVRPRFPEYEAYWSTLVREEQRNGRPMRVSSPGPLAFRQRRPVTYFEVYRGPTYLGSTWAVSHGGWMIWCAAEDEDPRFVNRLGDRLGAENGCLGFRSKRSQAVRVLLEYPNDPPYPRSVYDHHERWPGHEAFVDFVWAARELRDTSGITMGQAFSLALREHHLGWYEELRLGVRATLDPHDDDTRIPIFLAAVRELFHREATTT